MLLAVIMAAAASAQLLRMEHLCLEAPDGHTLEHQRGPDFALFYVRTPDTSTGRGSLGIYLGNHPRSFKPGGAVRSRSFPLGQGKGKWFTWETKAADGTEEYHAEATLKRPFIAGGLHLASRDPRCPEPEPLKPGEVPF